MPLPSSAVVLIQTHNRQVDRVEGGVTYYKPFGLFKNDAGTDPVTDEGDEIATSKDFDGTIQTLQSVSSKRGIMLYTDEQPGVPCMDFDGTDDWAPLTAGPLGGQVTYSALFCSKTATFNNYYSLLDQSDSIAPASDRWGLFETGQTYFHSNPFPAAVNREGSTLTSPFSVGPIDEWEIFTVTTNTATGPQLRGVGLIEQFGFGSFQLIALIMHDPADTAEVQAYLQTLKPGNVTPITARTSIRVGYTGQYGPRFVPRSVGIDPNAQAFIDAAGIVDPVEKSAINQLVIDLKSEGIWSLLTVIYPFVGGSSSSCSYNLKDPSQFQIAWNGTLTFADGGVTGDGVTGYGNTGLMSASVGVNGGSTVRLRTTTTGDNRFATGVNDASNFFGWRLMYDEGRTQALWGTFGSVVGQNSTPGIGLYSFSRTSASLITLYKDGSSVGTNTTPETVTLPVGSFYVAARNATDDGVPGGYLNAQMAFLSIHQGLSGAQTLALYNAESAFQTTLGRNP